MKHTATEQNPKRFFLCIIFLKNQRKTGSCVELVELRVETRRHIDVARVR